MPKTTTDVLVVGAGPVGLLLATELQQRGVDHLLLEQKQEPTYFCKALGVSRRTLEVFDQIGVLREALDLGLWLRGQGASVNGAPLQLTTFGVSALPYLPVVMAQYDTEHVLRTQLLRSGGRVEFGTELRSFEERADGIRARIGHDGGEQTIECRYVVGCDGAHSAVRRGLNLSYEGDAYAMTFMLGDVLVHADLPRGYAYRLTQTVDGQMRNVVVCIPIPGDPRRYRLSMAAPPEAWSDEADLSRPPTLEQITAVCAPVLPAGATLSDLRWSSYYRISHRIAPRYDGGRAFIAGDAAHIHPPIGGQGMNTGLQDVHNLAWKLGLAVAGRAAPDLLASYSAERQPVGMEVVTRTSRRMDQTVEGKDAIAEVEEELKADSQLFINYRDSRIVGDDVRGGSASGARAGDLAPDAGLLRDGSRQPLRLKELLRTAGHTLLLYSGKENAEAHYRSFAALSDELRQKYGDAIKTVGIVAAGSTPIDLERFPLLHDADGQFAAAYGAAGPALYLIRPDGYLGYRNLPADRGGLEHYLQRIMTPIAGAQ